MTAPVEQPPGRNRRDDARGSGSPLRMRVAPEAVIIVTKSSRIVLVDSPDWSMDEFNRREIVEILVPRGFAASDLDDAKSCHEPAHLPVELVVGRGEATHHFTNPSRESESSKLPSDREFSLEPGLVRLADDPILASLADGTVVSWNAGARSLYGYSAEEILGKPASLLVPYELRASEERNRETVLSGDVVVPYDTLRLSKAGVSTAVSVSISPIRDEAGAIVGTLEIGRDVSRRQSEEKALADQVATLSQSNRELQDYALVAAHDLQSPLNTLAAYFAELSQRCESLMDDETRELLAAASAAVPRMQTLVMDLLKLARLDDRSPDLVRTDCGAVVSQVLLNLDLAIKESAAAVSIGSMPIVKADPTQIGQVFQNLISNALKFRAGRAPQIHVGAEQRPGEWRFSISDNGIGIDLGMIPRLFQPLQRLQPNGLYPGNGLGLAIAKKILTRHGGRIWVESRPGKGTTFYFTLPVSDSNDSTGSL